jgi:hypothetical protein
MFVLLWPVAILAGLGHLAVVGIETVEKAVRKARR